MSQVSIYGSGSRGSGAIDTINNIAPDGSGNFTLTAGTGITLTPGTNAITISSTASGGIVTIDGDSGSVTGTTILLTGGTSGGVFIGASTTLTQSFNFLALPNTNSGGTVGYISLGGNRFISNFGTENTFVGQESGNASTTGVNNVGIGAAALLSVTSGSDNTAIGDSALAVLTTSSLNTAIGNDCLVSLTGGTGSNTAVGYDAGSALASGAYNILIGADAGSAYSTTESSNILIGTGSAGVEGESNVIRIGVQGSGTAEQDTCYIAGITGVTTSNTQMVTINTSTGQLGAAAVPASGGLTWSVITSNQSAVKSNAYIANSSGTLILTLPSTAAVGDTFLITGINNNTGWQIAQNAGQIIHYGAAPTTTGTGGSLASTNTYDTITITCVVDNTTFIGYQSQGNIQVT